MHNYRAGDEVTIQLSALVTRVTGDVIRVRFGDTEYDADPATLEMVARSMHVGDDVKHGDRDGVIAQMLEEGVFLVRFPGATGAEAYGVASRGELKHPEDATMSEAPARPETAPQTTAPAASPEAQADDAQEPLELTDPAPEGAKETATAPRTAASIGDMAASLSSVSNRQPRRQPLDLESIGTTETVPGVRGEMTLGDDMRLGGPAES